MKWILPEQSNAPLLDWIISTRNIADKNKFFKPEYKDLHDPFLMHDMEKAAKVISKAVKDKKKIFIHGDFDVDGITATSIMWLFLHNDLGADALPYIPNRFVEGYGLSEDTIQKIIDAEGDLIITVDCGVKDIELVNKYADKIDFIITDHHTIRPFDKENLVEGGKQVGEYYISDKAQAVVHPLLQNSYPFKEICGALVSWKVCEGINRHLGSQVDMSKYLDLASLGTVCDVMPLVDENRSVVKLGLDIIRHQPRMGIRDLLNIASAKGSEISSYHLGFVIGPRLNASGRLEDAMEAVRLLTTSSPLFSARLAAKLEALNNERRELTKKYLQEAEKIIETQLDNKIFIVIGDGWPEGILGLIAGKLTDKYSRPVIVGSRKKDSIKASARSIEDFNIASALKDSSKFLTRYGGHSQAAGLSLLNSEYDSFSDFLTNYANDRISEGSMEKNLKIDGIASLSDLNFELMDTLSSLEPYGHMNSKPIVALIGVSPKNFLYLGKEKNHIKFSFEEPSGIFESIGFGMSEKFKKEILASESLYSTPLDFAGNLEINEWNGIRKISLKLEDFRISKK